MDELLDEKTYETRTVRYASFYQRTSAFLIDALLFLIAAYGVYYMFGNAPSFMLFLRQYIWQVTAVILFYFIYLDGGEKNATFGKQVMNIRLLNEERREIGFSDSAKHCLLSVILFFGYFRMLWNKKNQTLADSICKITAINR
jgi:uncharacterized RDD family membrane protein YckC